MHIDLPTMFAMTAFVTIVAGAMLLFSWLQDRAVVSLAFWGAGYLVFSVGGVLTVLRGEILDTLWASVGSTLCILASGLMWCGARSFEGRKPSGVAAISGAACWVVLSQFDVIASSPSARIIFTTLAIACYTLLTAVEYWRAKDKELMSRWPAIVLLLAYAAMCFLRIPFVGELPFPAGTAGYDPNWFPYGAFALFVNNFCMAFLIVNMTKERAELRQRQTALVDSLTGVANRRAFMEAGERVLQRTLADGNPAAVLVLDLDLFKKINDTFGHQTGDRVLCAFCDTANLTLRPGDLFGRMGGEEFACLLPGASEVNALSVAERIRASFEGRQVTVGAQVSKSTVSIGVAMAIGLGHDLPGLMAAADRALYQAKANGRNRVEQVRVTSPPLQPGMQPPRPDAAVSSTRTQAQAAA